MCDYSLHNFPNRLAVEGEELVVHRFGGASLGLASAEDLETLSHPFKATRRTSGLLAAFRAWFDARVNIKLACAICVPPGAKLNLRDVQSNLQRELGVLESEEVTFMQTSAEVNTYRDAIRFANGRQVLLQALREGQRVTVINLGADEAETGEYARILSEPERQGVAH